MGSYDFDHCGHKQHFACFGCRKSFKAPYESILSAAEMAAGVPPHEALRRRVVKCPECGQAMTAMGLLFRAPPRRAVKQWRALEEAYRGAKIPPFEPA